MKMDSLFSFSGNYSLIIKKLSKNDSLVGKMACTLPNGFLNSQNLNVSAKLKVNKSNIGKTGIYINVLDAQGNVIKSADTLFTIYNKDEIWSNLSLVMDIPADGDKVFFGAMSSADISWFDGFEIIINGRKYEEEIPPMIIPTRQELEWLKNAQVLPNY